jgi:hypothetical protein
VEATNAENRSDVGAGRIRLGLSVGMHLVVQSNALWVLRQVEM